MEAMNSILRQSFADFEVIVVDDGSTDGTYDLLQRLAATDARIKIHRKENGGIVSALNHGLARCSGKYVARMDCDDLVVPERLDIQIKEFEKYPDAVAVGGLVSGINEDGEILYAPTLFSSVRKTRLDIFPPRVAMVHHPSGTFLREALNKVGGYRNTFPHAEDWDLFLRLAALGNLYNPDRLVMYYREHNASISTKNMISTETYGALAELSALARQAGIRDPGNADTALSVEAFIGQLDGKVCSLKTIRRYVNLRLWRRTYGRKHPKESYYRGEVLSSFFKITSYLTWLDLQLTLRSAIVAYKFLLSGRLKRLLAKKAI